MGARVDAVGVEHPVADAGARIVSLVPSITELLFHMNLGERVVARTTFCVHPAADVADVPRVGGTKKPAMDRLRSLAPTHVIVNVDENRREDVDEMAAFVPHVVVTHPLVPDDNLALYRLIGAVFDREAEAETLCTAFRAARETLAGAAADLPPRRVLYLIWRDPWMTVSGDTYIARTLALANLHTVGHDPDVRYPEVRVDERCVEDVDLVLFSSEPFPFKREHVDEFQAATRDRETPWAFIDAEMTSWYGSRAVAGLDYLRDFAANLETGGNPA